MKITGTTAPSGIVAHSPTIEQEGAVPLRIVIRYWKAYGYVVHVEEHVAEHGCFFEGKYFAYHMPDHDKGISEDDARLENLAEAWKEFERRSRLLMGGIEGS